MKYIILLLAIAACSSCTLTTAPDGSLTATVDPVAAAKILSNK